VHASDDDDQWNRTRNRAVAGVRRQPNLGAT
jgi:hypothetical protein